MAFTPPTSIEYTGDGTTTLYTFPFDYLDADYVEVLIDDSKTSDWSFETSSSVRLDSAPAHGTTIRIRRRTKSDTMLTDFQDASVLREKDLDLGFNQLLNVYQEAFNEADNALGIVLTLSENAESYVEASEQGALDAQSAQSSAETAESNALGHRNAALTYRNEAEGFRDQADNSASSASSAAITAVNARDAAEDSETNAANSENAAYEWANEAKDVFVSYGGNTGYSAYHYSQLANDSRIAAEDARSYAVIAKDSAQSSATNAGTSASDAESHADDASDSASLASDRANHAFDWANASENQQLTLGGNTGYSAYHWAKQAEATSEDANTLGGYPASDYPRKSENAYITGVWDFGNEYPPTFDGAKVWTEANDGPGSGLHADKLGGRDANKVHEIRRGGYVRGQFTPVGGTESKIAIGLGQYNGIVVSYDTPDRADYFEEASSADTEGTPYLKVKKEGWYRVTGRLMTFDRATNNSEGFVQIRSSTDGRVAEAYVTAEANTSKTFYFDDIVSLSANTNLSLFNNALGAVEISRNPRVSFLLIEFLGGPV